MSGRPSTSCERPVQPIESRRAEQPQAPGEQSGRAEAIPHITDYQPSNHVPAGEASETEWVTHRNSLGRGPFGQPAQKDMPDERRRAQTGQVAAGAPPPIGVAHNGGRGQGRRSIQDPGVPDKAANGSPWLSRRGFARCRPLVTQIRDHPRLPPFAASIDAAPLEPARTLNRQPAGAPRLVSLPGPIISND